MVGYHHLKCQIQECIKSKIILCHKYQFAKFSITEDLEKTALLHLTAQKKVLELLNTCNTCNEHLEFSIQERLLREGSRPNYNCNRQNKKKYVMVLKSKRRHPNATITKTS